MSRATAAAQEHSPEALFIRLWQRATAWSPSLRALSTVTDANLTKGIQDSLLLEDGASAYKALQPFVPNDEKLGTADCGRVLLVMRCIDQFFYQIHPRSVVLPASRPTRLKEPGWLRNLREARVRQGWYAQSDEWRLIPRGPLVRQRRDEAASFAENLADRFSALAVVPTSLAQAGRKISVHQRVVWYDAARGVPPGMVPGEEKLVYVPVAEEANDIEISCRHRPEQSYLDYRLRTGLNAADRLIEALRSVGHFDIAIAPELVMREEHADEIPERLNSAPAIIGRMIIAGSGQTREEIYGQPWNETQVINGSGAILWRQRKIWPAGINHDRATSYGVTDLGPSKLMLEDTASDDVVEVVDIDSVGRCIVLICQDLEASPMTADLIQFFQPDWIFTPILDPAIKTGNWAHQRCFALSGSSPARFVVASSTTLAKRTKSSSMACGLTVGPRDGDGTSERRNFALHVVHPGSTPGAATLVWNKVSWQKTEIAPAKS